MERCNPNLGNAEGRLRILKALQGQGQGREHQGAMLCESLVHLAFSQSGWNSISPSSTSHSRLSRLARLPAPPLTLFAFSCTGELRYKYFRELLTRAGRALRS